MEIVQYTSDLQSPLTEFYNRQTINVPHCYPVKEEEFALEMRGITDNVEDSETLDSEAAFIAITQGAVQAFIHVGTKREVDEGIIRFLGYERGARRAGQAVLEKAEAYLKACNVTRIYAFPYGYLYRFYYFGGAHLSDALDQVQALLGFNGYHRSGGEVFLDWENYSITPMPSSMPVTFSVEWEQGRGQLPNCTVSAYLDGKEIGDCDSVSGGQFSSHPDAQDWFYTAAIAIEGPFQGQGIGRYLLQYTLQEMCKIGYRHATISSRWDNYRAFLFYSNCGYRAVDWTYGFQKTFC